MIVVGLSGSISGLVQWLISAVSTVCNAFRTGRNTNVGNPLASQMLDSQVETLSKQFKYFSEKVYPGSSPLYQGLSARLAEDHEILSSPQSRGRERLFQIFSSRPFISSFFKEQSIPSLPSSQASLVLLAEQAVIHIRISVPSV